MLDRNSLKDFSGLIRVAVVVADDVDYGGTNIFGMPANP